MVRAIRKMEKSIRKRGVKGGWGVESWVAEEIPWSGK